MRSLILTLVLGLGMTSVARAQDFEAAGRHFSSAQEAFGAQHFKTAAVEFEAAYAITKDPVLLYNVAESYEKAGDGRKAVANYKAYLHDQPNAQDKAEVQRRIKAIDARHGKLVDQSAPGDNPPTPATTTAPTPPTPSTPSTPPPTQPAPTLKEPATTAPPLPPPPGTTTTLPQSTAPTQGGLSPPTPPPSAPTPEVVAPGPTTTAPEPAAVPAATAPPAEPPPGLLDEGPTTKMRVAAWIGVASTLAVLTAGAIFGLAAQSRADEISRRLSFVDMSGQPHKFDAGAQTDLQSLRDDGNLYNGLAIGFYSVAAVSAVATVVLFVVDAKRPRPTQHAWRVAPVVGKNAAGFALGGSF